MTSDPTHAEFFYYKLIAEQSGEQIK